MKRRDFITKGLQICSLPLLQGHIPLGFAVKNFQVFWLHLEGAPIREAFDFWPDPKNQFNIRSLNAGQRPMALRRGDFALPNIWHNLGKKQSSHLLDHWLAIRGIELKGPHLKEARRQWFRDDSDSELSIIQKFDKSFKEHSLESVDLITTDSLVKEIYDHILKKPMGLIDDGSTKSLFAHWKSISQKREKPPLSLAIVRSPKTEGEEQRNFESFDRWDEDTRKIHEDYFADLLQQIGEFSKFLEISLTR